MYPPVFLLSPCYFLLRFLERIFSRTTPSVCCRLLVDSYQNKKIFGMQHIPNCFHAQTLHNLSPSKTVCCWLGVTYAWASLSKYLFNACYLIPPRDYSWWKQKIIKQLLCQANTLKLEWNTASLYFFLVSNYHDNYLLIASVLFFDLHGNSAICFCNSCKSVYFDNPFGSSSVYR